MSTDSKTLRLQAEVEQDRLKKQKESEWRAGFETMANDPESMNVDYAFPAQAEVVLGERGCYDPKDC